MGVGRDFTLRSFHLHLSAKPDGTTGANAWLYGFSTRGSLRPWYRRRIGRGRKDQESRSNRYLPGLQPQAVLAPGTLQRWTSSIDPKDACIARSEPALLNNTTLQTATITQGRAKVGSASAWPPIGRRTTAVKNPPRGKRHCSLLSLGKTARQRRPLTSRSATRLARNHAARLYFAASP